MCGDVCSITHIHDLNETHWNAIEKHTSLLIMNNGSYQNQVFAVRLKTILLDATVITETLEALQGIYQHEA